MLTVLESLKLSTEYLEKKSIESPRINAEILLAHVLNCRRLDLYLSFDRPLSDDEKNSYRELLKRRALREPLQYITGYVEFYGLRLNVNSSVLIPRPETELLVEEVIKHVKEGSRVKILDIGTGSGNIAIALASNLPDAQVTGIDISGEALRTAAANAELNTAPEIKFINKDITRDPIFNEMFDIVVSNPPYVSIDDFNSLQPELKVYEPQIALTDDGDGYKFYRIIIGSAEKFLKPGGLIFFEIGKGQSIVIKKIMEENNFSDIEVFYDYAKFDRIIKGVLK